MRDEEVPEKELEILTKQNKELNDLKFEQQKTHEKIRLQNFECEKGHHGRHILMKWFNAEDVCKFFIQRYSKNSLKQQLPYVLTPTESRSSVTSTNDMIWSLATLIT